VALFCWSSSARSLAGSTQGSTFGGHPGGCPRSCARGCAGSNITPCSFGGHPGGCPRSCTRGCAGSNIAQRSFGGHAGCCPRSCARSCAGGNITQRSFGGQLRGVTQGAGDGRHGRASARQGPPRVWSAAALLAKHLAFASDGAMRAPDGCAGGRRCTLPQRRVLWS
jgi:hypothetical protein